MSETPPPTLTTIYLFPGHREIAQILVEGDIDLYTSPYVKSYTLEKIKNGARVIILDLEKCGYVDSTGLGVFVGLQRKAQELKGEVIPTSLQPRVKRLLDVTRLSSVFKTCINLGDAILYVKENCLPRLQSTPTPKFP